MIAALDDVSEVYCPACRVVHQRREHRVACLTCRGLTITVHRLCDECQASQNRQRRELGLPLARPKA